mgnify:CR=1 FL=1
MLEIHDLQKSFGDLYVLRGINLNIQKGDVVAVLGSSGSGKTTLLRCMNFLEHADAGTMVFDGQQVELSRITHAQIHALRRRTGFVFQNYNLFLNKTALQNVTEGLIVARKMHKAEAVEIGKKALDKVGLSDRYDYYPSQLSGGQCQRVAIGRALIDEPEVLLMDEPFSALDALTREKLQEEVLRLSIESGVTLVLVTHSIEEAVYVCDHLLVYSKDSETPQVIDNTKTPQDRYDAAFVAQCARVKAMLEGGESA